MGRRLALAFALLVLPACGSTGGRLGSPDDPQVTPGTPFALKAGQSATSADGALVVEFLAVSGDSRCPRDVTCVWEGDATVNLATRQGSGAPARHELHTAGGPHAQFVRVGPFRLELVKLEPLPETGRTLRPEEYEATLKVVRE